MPCGWFFFSLESFGFGFDLGFAVVVVVVVVSVLKMSKVRSYSDGHDAVEKRMKS